jgi:CBS domain-containing protein
MDGRNFIGFLDLLDLVKAITNLFWGSTVEEWTDFWTKETDFQRQRISDVMVNKTNDLRSCAKVYQDSSLFQTIEIMARRNVHRVAIMDDRKNNQLVGILTQSMVLSELYQRIHLLGALRHKKVSELTSYWRDVITINESARAMNAFNVMASNDIGGLAVVDDAGVLQGAISISDLKAVGTSGEFFSRLFRDIKTFKRLCNEEYPTTAPRAHYSKKPVPRKALYVTPSQTFEDVIKMMDDGNIHRVFVCDEKSHLDGVPKPLHVITQTNILYIILRHYTY